MFCGRRKDGTRQLSSILKRLTLTRLQTFTSRIVTFKILTQVPLSVWIIIFISYLLPPTSLDSSGDKNLFHQSRTCSGTSDFFPSTESLGVVTEECIPGYLFSLECPPGGRQMF